MDAYFRAFHGPTDWGWVRERNPIRQVEDTGGIVVVDRATNTTVAACIFDMWTANSVNAHVIIDNPMVLRHGFFEEVADYAFNVAGRKIMIGYVPGTNTAALSLNPKIGFVEAARIPDGYADGVDMVIQTMTREQCAFYTPQEETADGVL